MYLGGACDVLINDHTVYTREVTDCNDPAQVDQYCVLSHGALNKDPIAEDCPCGGSPVEESSWGNIKALYR